MFDAAQVATDTERALRGFADPTRAIAEKRYLKSDLVHLGASMPRIRGVTRQVVAAHPALTRRELLAVVHELWGVGVHERRMAAVLLLEARVALLSAADLAVIEGLIREAGGWAMVDMLSGNVTGEILAVHRDGAATIDRWAGDRDFWVRRSALLSALVPHRKGQPLDRFLGHAEAMLDEKEFFIRKAIGWVLREAGKSRPDEVVTWLLPRTARASGVTMREAVKYLPASKRDRLLAAWKPAKTGATHTGR
jgi:3-methyladenine DNA glycosylase AlkD